jgi:autotransporter-associated beta strand protein
VVSNGGTLFVESASASGAWAGQAEQVAATIYVSGAGNSEGFGALRVDDAAIITGNIILQGNTVYGGTYTSPYGVSGVSGVIDDLGQGYGIFCANDNNGGQAEEFWGANTYHGGTTWTNAAYTLVMGNGSALQNSTLNIGPGQMTFDSVVSSNSFLLGGLTGSANIALTNNSDSAITLSVGNNNSSTTYSGSLSDNGVGSSFTKVGTGTLAIDGENSYNGATTIAGGTLVMNTLQTNVTTGIAVNDGTGLTLNISGTNQLAPAIYTLGSSTGPVTNGFVGLTSTTVAPVITSSLVLNGQTIINIIGGSFTVGHSYPLISSASISGSGGFMLGALPRGLTCNLVTNGGNTIALQVTAYTPTIDVWTGAINTNWDIAGTTNWLISGSPNTYFEGDNTRFDDSTASNNVFVKTVVSPNSTTVSNLARTYVFTGSGINGAGGLLKQGGGLLVLAQTNTYNGNTVISNGTIQLAAVNAIPGGGGKGDVTVDGTLDLSANNDLINGLSGSGTIDTVAGGTPILTIGSSGSSSTFGGVIQNTAGTLAVTKSGGGTITLGGNNTYAGATTVSAGILKIASATALGAGLATVANGATLDLNGQTIGETLNSILGTGVGGSGALINSSNAAAMVSTPINAAGGSVFAIGGSGNITLEGIARGSGSGQFDVTNLDEGTLELIGTADNAYLNLHAVNGTVLLDKTSTASVHAASALFVEGGIAQLAGTGGVQVYPGNTLTVNSGTLDLNGQTMTVGALVGFGGMILNSLAGSTATLVIATATSGEYYGTLTNGSGVLALTQTGTGVAYLAGVNVYTGSTLVEGGTLYLVEPASISNSVLINVTNGATLDVTARNDSTLTLNNGQTLTGGGLVNGNVTSLAGAIINPGGGVAVNTLNVSENVNLGGELLMDLNDTNTPVNCDQLTVSGTPTYGGVLSVTNIGPTLQVGDTFQLFSAAAGGFASINLPTTDASGYRYSWNNNIAANGSISVAVVISPVNTNPTNITATVTNDVLTLSWPADHTGWRLLVQTNSLTTGLSSNTNDWTPVAGSAAINQTNLQINPALPTEFYRLVYP